MAFVMIFCCYINHTNRQLHLIAVRDPGGRVGSRSKGWVEMGRGGVRYQAAEMAGFR